MSQINRSRHSTQLSLCSECTRMRPHSVQASQRASVWLSTTAGLVQRQSIYQSTCVLNPANPERPLPYGFSWHGSLQHISSDQVQLSQLATAWSCCSNVRVSPLLNLQLYVHVWNGNCHLPRPDLSLSHC